MQSSLRTADVYYNLTDGSINAVQNLSHSIPQTLSQSEFLSSFTFLFGNDSSAQDPSNSTMWEYGGAVFWLAQEYSGNQSAIGYGPVFMSPLLLFQPLSRYLTTPYATQLYWPIAYPNFTVTNDSLIELAQSYPIPSIPRISVLVYLAVSAFIFIWCMRPMVLALLVDTTPTSNFDLLDFAARITANRYEGSFIEPLAALSNGQDVEFRKALEDKNIFVRDVEKAVDCGDEESKHIGKIGFTMKGDERRKLIQGSLYA